MSNHGVHLVTIRYSCSQLFILFLNEALSCKQISDGASLAARYCLLTQRGNYRSQVVNNFIGLLAKALDLDLGDELPAPEETAKI